MKKLLRLFALLAFSSPAFAAEPSLYRQFDARKLTRDEAVMFGPQAGKFRYDERMIRAAAIAQARAQRRSKSLCWRAVKTALLEAGAVDSYPKTVYAKEAARELPKSYGFRRIRCRDPYRAPLGSVLVYGGADAGHVEIKTSRGYASDFISPRPYTKRPLVGIFVKPRA